MAEGLSPRYLVLDALAKATRPSVDEIDEIGDGVPLPKPGDMQIFSYMKPGLTTGEYTIEVSQKVIFKGAAQDLSVRGKDPSVKQTFEVTSSQFALPPEDFHSTYPPQGHADQPNIAPHVVLSDPHLPWERDPSKSGAPWLALLPFDCNHPSSPELNLTSEQQKEINAALHLDEKKTLGPNFSLSTTVKDYLNLETELANLKAKTVVKVPAFKNDSNYSSLQTDTTPVDLIFLKASLFRKLFYIDGKADIQQFQYCAHVRNVNTQGVTGAGISSTGLFSIIHSKRSGPTDISAVSPPRSQAVHLLTLEHIQDMDVPDSDEVLIPIVSLYRWTYLCEPPLSTNFIDLMRKIGIQVKHSQGVALDTMEALELGSALDIPPNCYLKCPPSVLKRMAGTTADEKRRPSKIPDMRRAMLDRMEHGFSLVRYRVQSGEETVGLFRGVLLPNSPAKAPATWPSSSNNGQDFQMFDKALSMMNITYSAAWQLGRLMASSDIGFVSALMRIRSRAYQQGLQTSNLMVVNSATEFKSKAHFFSSLPWAMASVQALSISDTMVPTADLRSRWARESEDFELNVDDAAFGVGVENLITMEGSAAGTGGQIPIQDCFAATSEDWRIIHDWILNRIYLSGIPTHYLITDPSMLPPESIRFFHIDKQWKDCFIDGALSCANHTALNDEDTIRSTIRDQFNKYLDTAILAQEPGTVTKSADDKPVLHKPQIPCWGFFIRSAVISAFKDLIVEIPFKEGSNTDGKAPILVQKKLGADILMVLLDRLPESGEITNITFRQPAHQQRFCVADFLDESRATYLWRKMYYKSTNDLLDQFGDEIIFQPSDGANSIYDWNSRCFNFRNMERLHLDKPYSVAVTKSSTIYDFYQQNWTTDNQRHLTSSAVGILLNDTVKYLTFLPPSSPKPTPNELDSIDEPPERYLIRTAGPCAKRRAARATIDSILNARHKTVDIPDSLGLPFLGVPEPPKPLIIPVQNFDSIPASMLLKAPTAMQQAEYDLFLDDNESKPDSNDDVPSGLPNVSVTNSMAYVYKLYPRGEQFPKNLEMDRGYIWSDVPYADDLIISIRRSTKSVSDDLGLWEVQFTIPLGPSSERKKTAKTPNVIEGPGLVPLGLGGVSARMLSNQRWVAALAISAKHLTIRIVPRTKPQVRRETVARNLDLSLIIRGLDTSWQTASEGKEPGLVNCRVAEIYGHNAAHDQGSVAEWLYVTPKTGWKG